ANLRRYALTLDRIAAVIRQSSVELPGGGVKTDKGEVLLRTDERRRGSGFSDITVLANPDGTEVKVSDIAEVKDGFADTEQSATFNGKPAVMVKVFRTGDEGPVEVSEAVHEFIDKNQHLLPPGAEYTTWFDMSEFYEGRIDLLIRNAKLGLILVIIVLGLFLELRLAFWVTLGIPISFVGSLLIIPHADVSINMISLFAFILVLGMVVDDAIIVGEEIYKRRQEGMGRMQAAIFGVKSVAVPVVFAIATTIIFYLPLLFVPGISGKFFRVIPITVIATLIMSLIESLLILPAHLGHGKKTGPTGVFAWIDRQQQKFSRGLEWVITRTYIPTVRWVTHYRYISVAIAFSVLISSCGIIAGGRINMIFLPKVEGDQIQALIELPYGAPVEDTELVRDKALATLREILEEAGGEEAISRGIFAQIGATSGRPGDPGNIGLTSTGSNLTEVALFMVPEDNRSIAAGEVAQTWRDKMRDVPGIDKLSFNYSTGPSGGAALSIDLSHPQMDVLELAAADLSAKLQDYGGVFDIDDGFQSGKEQLSFKLKPGARSLGITELELARQVRGAFFGSEAVRQQRGREEVRVYVRLPKKERESEYNVEQLLIRTPGGGEVPLSQAAEVIRGRSYTSIRRKNGARVVSVTADVDQASASGADITADVIENYLPELMQRYPGLAWDIGGEQKEMGDMMESLKRGFIFALIAAIGLLAIAFRSYMQPIIIMTAIPFGFVGALWGHVLLGFDLSMMSWMGVVALAGVVVNDSLILVVAVNQFREGGMTTAEAVVAAGARRFRPILLTSLTTFFGLAPMILETSVQARFLIPMAVSLGFGVMFATFITLLLVPAIYVILDDLKSGLSKAWHVSRSVVTGEYPVPPLDEPEEVLPKAATALGPEDDDEPESAS
ncbi:MAG: efflux RND transporter permease subunit, partial [Deltaproteobacteria bacterium]|nr:efflux RND transporter permease subunit [Deltaproteobacteria bacterium]